MLHPLRMILFCNERIESLKSLLKITYKTCIYTDVLIDLSCIHIDMNDLGILSKLLGITGNTV